MRIELETLNIEHCKDEPIHTPGRIQSYGYLFGIDKESFSIKVISENQKELLKVCWLGENLFELFELNNDEFNFLINTFKRCERLKLRLDYKVKIGGDHLLHGGGAGQTFSCVVYESSDLFIIELEKCSGGVKSFNAKHSCITFLKKAQELLGENSDVCKLYQNMLHEIKELTGYERIFIYKFFSDNSGKVVAEIKDSELESYLCVRFPEKDIPPQARSLYVKNLVRIIPSLNAAPSPLIFSDEMRGKQLDLSLSMLRDQSPFHKRYLENMGVGSSMSISILIDGELWGLVSCHHRMEHYVPQEMRLECEMLGQLFGWQVSEFEKVKALKDLDIVNGLLEKIEGQACKHDLIAAVEQYEEEILSLMDSSGFAYRSEIETINLGEVAGEQQIFELGRLATSLPGNIYVSCQHQRESEDKGQVGSSGVLVTADLENQKFLSGWFRTAELQVQKWIGETEEESPVGNKKRRLMPRANFKVVEREVHGQCRPWMEHELYLAERIHRLFLIHTFKEQEKIKRTLSHLRAMNNSKDEFLVTLAHELRNPLAALSAAVEMLGANESSEKEPALKVMQRGLMQMSTLVEDLMDVSKIIHGKLKLRREVIDINSVVENAFELTKSDFAMNKHSVEIKNSDSPIYVCGDFTRLTQVFVNLLNNASKYTPTHGLIKVCIESEYSKAKVIVKDNGIGISAKDIDKIFRLFSQIKNEDTTSDGLGLGLSLVEKLIKMHGGEISVKSDGPKKGSEFIARLPVVKGPCSTKA